MTTTRILNHPITILVLTIVAITFFLSLNKSSKKKQNSSENIRVLEYEVNQISEEIIELEENITETESIQFKEKVVRNELLLQKEGEYVLQIAENKEEDNSQISNDSTLKDVNPINRWFELLYQTKGL